MKIRNINIGLIIGIIMILILSISTRGQLFETPETLFYETGGIDEYGNKIILDHTIYADKDEYINIKDTIYFVDYQDKIKCLCDTKTGCKTTLCTNPPKINISTETTPDGTEKITNNYIGVNNTKTVSINEEKYTINYIPTTRCICEIKGGCLIKNCLK